MKASICILLSIWWLCTFGQPAILWNQNFGGTGLDVLDAIAHTSNDGFIVACSSNSNDYDITCGHGQDDVILMKFNSDDHLVWIKCYGGSENDGTSAIIQTQDYGYLFAGESQSNDGDVIGNHGAQDYWIVKLDSLGNIEWQKCLGGSSTDYLNSVIETNNGDYMVVGYSYSNDGDVGIHYGNFFNANMWIVKLDHLGKIKWSKVIGDSTFSWIAHSVIQTKDGNYLISGSRGAPDIGSAAFEIKLDTAGTMLWQKFYGGSLYDGALSATELSDGNFVFLGGTNSNDGEVSGNHGGDDYWLVKFDTLGNFIWQHCFGGSKDEEPSGLLQTKDKGFVIVGITYSSDGQVTNFHGAVDYWIVKTDSDGNFLWQKDLGGSNEDNAKAAIQENSGDLIIGGYSNSTDGDFTMNYGGFSDIWLTELSIYTGIIQSHRPFRNFSIFPNPATNEVNIPFPFSNNIITIYDLYGRELQHFRIGSGNSAQLNIHSLQTGIYLVEIKNEKGNVLASEKLFKE